MRVQRQQLIEALQQARREQAAAATIIEEIGPKGSLEPELQASIVDELPCEPAPSDAASQMLQAGRPVASFTPQPAGFSAAAAPSYAGCRKRRSDADAPGLDLARENKWVHFLERSENTDAMAMEIA